jgi:lactoylglutathione lyase
LEVGLARRGVVERRLRAGIEHDSAIDEDASQEIGERSSMPGQAVPVRGLFESHLTVTDLRRSVAFYRDVVGLPLALEAPERGAAFFWCGTRGKTMLGLWSLGSMPMGLSLHIAFDVNLDHVLDSPRRLTALGVTPLSFFGEETDEPTVIGWMPAATVYFRDPAVTCSSTSPCSTPRPERISGSSPGPSGIGRPAPRPLRALTATRSNHTKRHARRQRAATDGRLLGCGNKPAERADFPGRRYAGACATVRLTPGLDEWGESAAPPCHACLSKR